MNLQLKRHKNGLLALFGDDGELLPGQMSVEIDNEMCGMLTAVVRFHVDGRKVRIVGDGDGGTTDRGGDAQ